MRAHHRGHVIALIGLAVMACGGGDKGTTPTPVPQGFAVTLSGTTLTVEQGGVGTITANITRTGSFAGTVNLSLESVPTGVAASFAPASITSSTTQTTLTVTVGSSVAPGSYTFTIRGQAAGVADQTASVALTVIAKPAIALALAPTTASVAAGSATTFTATIGRTNFGGSVGIAITGAPTGVTTSVSTTGDVNTATVNVAGTVTPGQYTLTVTASGTGVVSVNVPFTLTVTAPPVATIALSAAPTAFSVQPGSTPIGTVVSITRTNFSGAVTLAVQSGLPAGLTAAFSPSGSTTGNSVIATFSAALGTPAGTYNVVLQGTGTGATTGTVLLTITVSGIPASSIALTAVPSTVTAAQGTSAGTVIHIVRTNITGAVSFTSSNVPAGVTATFGAPITTQNSSSLNLAVGASVPIGTYQITVTGSATGVSNVSITVTLNVTQGQVGGGNVTFTFCGAASSIPIWVAVQNAFGQWQRATPVATNTYSFTINSIGGVAWVTQTATDTYAMNLVYGTFVDLNARGAATCVSPTTKTVTGTVAGLTAPTDVVSVALGGAVAAPAPTQASPAFTIAGVPSGNVDLVGTRTSFNLATLSSVLNRIYIRRNLTPADGSSVGTVDFGSNTDAFAPDQKQLSIVGVNVGEQVTAITSFTSANGGVAALGSALGSATLNYFAVPASRTAVGDLHALFAFATTVSGGVTTAARGITAWSRDPAANTTLTLGSLLAPPSVTTVASAPYARIRSVMSRLGEYDNAWSAAFTQPARSVTIELTQGYMANNGAFDVTVPDFTAVTGWQNAWGLVAGVSTGWNVSAFGWVVGSGGNSEGAITRVSYRNGTITP